MRKQFLSALSLSALSAAAVTLDVARLPEPAFADREVSSDAALPANRHVHSSYVFYKNQMVRFERNLFFQRMPGASKFWNSYTDMDAVIR